MEVKCIKCRYRYDTPVTAGMTEVACVCPRCGMPFTYAIPEDAPMESRLNDDAAIAPMTDGDSSDKHRQTEAPNGRQVPEESKDVPLGNNAGNPFGRQPMSGGRRPAMKETKASHGCMRSCLIAFLLAFIVLVFAVRNCFGEYSYNKAMLENETDSYLDGGNEGIVVSDVDEFVEIHPEPIPDWLEGSWRMETNYGVITLVIHGNKLVEESGGQMSRGTFYYRKGKLYCDFGDGELTTYKVDLKKRQIGIDDMLMEKQ